MRRSRRGFTMLIAIACLALASVAITLVVGVARDDARRTIDERIEAQQRQLLLAGLRDVATRLNAGESPLRPGAIATPAEADAPLAVDSVDAASTDRAVVTISAGTLVQRATFARDATGAWTLAAAEIVR